MHSWFVRTVTTGVLGALLTILAPISYVAQGQSTPLSRESNISLITILPGDPVYTFAGHSALRVRDPANDIDRLYNYGTFDFGDPFFIPKFTYGYLRYRLSVSSYAPMVQVYIQQGRPVIEQHLQLSRSQRTAVYAFLEENAKPENRHYQYDFFFDNCSTRIHDVLKQTLGSKVDFSEAVPPDKTFRHLLDPYVASRPFLDLGFDLALGLPADRKATAREAMFLPDHLMRGFNAATISDGDTSRPLVSRTDTVQWVPDYDGMTPAPNWPLYLSFGFFVLVLSWTTWQAVMRWYPNRWADALLLASIGFAGLIICYLWFISTYTVTDNNLNLLWAWPTHLAAAPLLIRRPSLRGLRLYFVVTAAAAFLCAAAWPVWPQNFHLAVLPLVLAVGIRTGWWALLQSTGSLSPRSWSENQGDKKENPL